MRSDRKSNTLFKSALDKKKRQSYFTVVLLSKDGKSRRWWSFSKGFPLKISAFLLFFLVSQGILGFYAYHYFLLKEENGIQVKQYLTLRNRLEQIAPHLGLDMEQLGKPSEGIVKLSPSLTWNDVEHRGDGLAMDEEVLDEERLMRISSNLPDLIPVLGKFTSTYGWRPNPMTGQQKMHFGIDIAAPVGSAIRAAADGFILRVGRSIDYGNFVEVKHGRDIVTRYAHAFKVVVHQNEVVKKGAIIGTVGVTGHTTGPHLHYEVEIGGQRVDPAQFIFW